MLSLITPDNLPATLTAVGGLIGGGGVITVIRIWRNPQPKPGTADAAAVALAENTRALTAQGDQFRDNNRLFADVLKVVVGMAEDQAETTRETRLAREHLAAIRDALNRR